jgi:hypothetical protein
LVLKVCERRPLGTRQFILALDSARNEVRQIAGKVACWVFHGVGFVLSEHSGFLLFAGTPLNEAASWDRAQGGHGPAGTQNETGG